MGGDGITLLLLADGNGWIGDIKPNRFPPTVIGRCPANILDVGLIDPSIIVLPPAITGIGFVFWTAIPLGYPVDISVGLKLFLGEIILLS
jgi:hypothetical protein